MHLANDSPSFTPVHSRIRAIGTRTYTTEMDAASNSLGIYNHAIIGAESSHRLLANTQISRISQYAGKKVAIFGNRNNVLCGLAIDLAFLGVEVVHVVFKDKPIDDPKNFAEANESISLVGSYRIERVSMKELYELMINANPSRAGLGNIFVNVHLCILSDLALCIPVPIDLPSIAFTTGSDFWLAEREYLSTYLNFRPGDNEALVNRLLSNVQNNLLRSLFLTIPPSKVDPRTDNLVATLCLSESQSTSLFGPANLYRPYIHRFQHLMSMLNLEKGTQSVRIIYASRISTSKKGSAGFDFKSPDQLSEAVEVVRQLFPDLPIELTIVIRDNQSLKEIELISDRLGKNIYCTLIMQMPHRELLSHLCMHDIVIAETGGLAPPGILAADAALLGRMVITTVPPALAHNKYYHFLSSITHDPRGPLDFTRFIEEFQDKKRVPPLANPWQIDMLRKILKALA